MDLKVQYAKNFVMVFFVHLDLETLNTFSSNDNHSSMYWSIFVCHLVPFTINILKGWYTFTP